MRRTLLLRFICLSTVLVSFFAKQAGADDDFIYAVQVAADAQVSPPQIHLSWPADPYGATSYVVSRKLKGDASWGPGIFLSGTTYDYYDTTVVVGTNYEYQVVENAVPGATHSISYGYISTGIQVRLTDNRGKLVLIVATNSTGPLTNELARLQTDLTGEGWLVLRHNVGTNDTPASVKALIVNEYNADPANVNCVFLFGHVPVFETGDMNYDGHLVRPMPADAYYGDMDGFWTTNTDFMPTDIELEVGRVDLSNMTGDGGTIVWPNETELLRNYLNKDHAWRYKQFTVPRRALMGDLRGEEDGEATAGSGWRNFDQLVGHENTWTATVAPPYGSTDNSWTTNLWATVLETNAYLIAYGCGAGEAAACSGLGSSDGTFYDVRTRDVYGMDLKAPFVMLFGSWFGQWDVTDDLLRSVLATPTMGLEAFMAGRPHWFIHHVGLGETFGYVTRLNMNNSTLYQAQSNTYPRAIYIAMMGDPTLRLDPVGPPGTLLASPSGSKVNLNWGASTDSIVGYHVYRSSSVAGPFVRLTDDPIAVPTYVDTSVPGGSYMYEVRAIKLQSCPSGTYYNPSQGSFASAMISTAPPILVRVFRSGQNMALLWNSASTFIYRVQTRTNLVNDVWTDASSPITASGSTTTWTDTSTASVQRKFYRVVSP